MAAEGCTAVQPLHLRPAVPQLRLQAGAGAVPALEPGVPRRPAPLQDLQRRRHCAAGAGRGQRPRRLPAGGVVPVRRGGGGLVRPRSARPLQPGAEGGAASPLGSVRPPQPSTQDRLLNSPDR